MPYEVKKRSGKYHVVKAGETESLSGNGHATPGEAYAQIAAIEHRELGKASIDTEQWVHDTMVSWGDSVKDLSDKGLVGGYLVVFSPGDDPQKDLMGDYFTRKTDFRWAGKEGRIAIYHHGLDKTLKKTPIGSEWRLGHIDDVGLWVEAQLDMRDEYEKAIFSMSRKGKMGLSSGTASHLIEKEQDGQIKLWAIIEGSYTPTPMEKRTSVQPLSSIRAVTPFKTLVGLRQQEGHDTGIETAYREAAGPDTRQITLADPNRLVQWFRRNRRKS
jgi:hypothetical protein